MKVKKSSNFGVDISRNSNAGRKKTKSTQKRKESKNPKKL